MPGASVRICTRNLQANHGRHRDMPDLRALHVSGVSGALCRDYVKSHRLPADGVWLEQRQKTGIRGSETVQTELRPWKKENSTGGAWTHLKQLSVRMAIELLRAGSTAEPLQTAATAHSHYSGAPRTLTGAQRRETAPSRWQRAHRFDAPTAPA